MPGLDWDPPVWLVDVAIDDVLPDAVELVPNFLKNRDVLLRIELLKLPLLLLSAVLGLICRTGDGLLLSDAGRVHFGGGVAGRGESGAGSATGATSTCALSESEGADPCCLKTAGDSSGDEGSGTWTYEVADMADAVDSRPARRGDRSTSRPEDGCSDDELVGGGAALS